jgi:hypothetical protein
LTCISHLNTWHQIHVGRGLKLLLFQAICLHARESSRTSKPSLSLPLEIRKHLAKSQGLPLEYISKTHRSFMSDKLMREALAILLRKEYENVSSDVKFLLDFEFVIRVCEFSLTDEEALLQTKAALRQHPEWKDL